MRKIIFLLVLITLMLLSGEDAILGEATISFGGVGCQMAEDEIDYTFHDANDGTYEYHYNNRNYYFKGKRIYDDDDFEYEPVEVDSTNLDTLSSIYNILTYAQPMYPDMTYEELYAKIDSFLIIYENIIKLDTNSDIDDIIQYYGLYKQIEGLGARIDTLEQKIEVLEKAVEYEIFEQPKHDPNITYPIFNPLRDEFWEWKKIYGMRFNMPIVDPEWERFMKWKKRQLNPEKVTVDTVLTVDEIIADSLCAFGKLEMLPPTAQGTTTYDSDIDAILDELSDMWEAIDKINRRLK